MLFIIEFIELPGKTGSEESMWVETLWMDNGNDQNQKLHLCLEQTDEKYNQEGF